MRSRLWPGALVVASTAGLSAHAEAPAAVDAGVARFAEAARTSKGVAAYSALRRLWRRWEEADPSQIEAALASLERDAALEPPLRAYAGMLHAYARRRRGDLDGAKRRLAALGYVGRWLAVGPFDNEEKGSLHTAFGPEDDLAQPLVVGKAYEGKERPVAWRKIPAELASFGWLDLGNVVRPSEKVCADATTFVRSRSGKTSSATLWVGASGAFRAFFNAEEVLADPAYRSVEADRWAAKVDVRPGWNRLTVKVCGDEEGPVLQARLAGPDGAPSDDLEASHDLANAEAASKNARPRRAKAEAPKGVKVVSKGDPYAKGATDKAVAAGAPAATGGALARLAALTTDKKASADELEAMARYLALTGGDERGRHLARDLAARAAGLAPTTERLLLAGDLAEDRNARAAWIARARAGLAPAEDDSAVLLSEALHARGGANFRDATPYFDRLLAKDPSHVAAVLGRAELYSEAGLKHSALAALEEGVRRAPTALSLLRALAAQYRGVGRQTDAEEIERRYASLRADDVAWHRGQLEDAVARRDKPAALRAADRVLALDPDAFPSVDAAARALRAVGEEGRAVALYERRLDVAPDDVDALRALADLQGEAGRQERQIALLRRLLVLRPQAKDVREYLERQQPPKVRKDEAYAWDDVKLRELAKEAPPPGVPRRSLRDLHVTTVFQNGLASRFHQVAFQPLTEEAAAAARQFAFPYQAGREVVDLRAARVFRANGKVDESVETGDGPADNPAIAMYTSQRTFYVQLPRLSAGDLVEVRYRVEEITPRNEFGESFSETAALGALEPVRSLEYVLLAPKEKKLSVRAPAAGFVVDERDDDGFHAWRVRGERLAPIAQEPAMPPLAEVVPTVSASSFSTWDEVGKWYWGLAKDQLDADDEVRKKVAELTKGLTTDEAKVRAVYAFVVQRTRYVALEFGIEGFRPRRCALTLSRGWGDCKDKATVIVTMLRELGIEAHLVLVRSALRGDAATEPPSYALFDHAIAYVPKLDLFLDGTAEYTGSRELPAFVRGQPALIVTPSGSRLVRVPDPPSDATARTREVEVTVPDGAGPAALDLRVEATGAIAAEFRQRFHAKATQKGRIVEDFGPAFGGLSVAERGVDVSDLEDVESPVKIRVQAKALGLARRAEGELSFVAAPSTGLVERYASLSTRHHPVRIAFAHTLDDTWTIKLPAQAKVTHAPESRRVESPFGKLEITVDRQPGKIVARSRLKIDKTRVSVAEYPEFKRFCEAVDRALGERVVIGR
ncbi:MAG: DUF3857 domain-containing protein [Polyangiaceae bacterium]|nr:DUF3857 domain-containing protein [Polyangiaceae bacterium]